MQHQFGPQRILTRCSHFEVFCPIQGDTIILVVTRNYSNDNGLWSQIAFKAA